MKRIALLMLIAANCGAAFGQGPVATGNLPATKDDLERIDAYRPSPTSSNESEVLPKSVDIGTGLTVRHQYQQGACTAFAIAYAAEILNLNAGREPLKLSPYFLWDWTVHRIMNFDQAPLPEVDSAVCTNWGEDRINMSIAADENLAEYRRRCRDCGCGLCSKGGISIPRGLYELKRVGGLPIEDKYSQADCGKSDESLRPALKSIITAKYTSETRYFMPSNNFESDIGPEIIDEIKQTLAQRVPVVVGVNVNFKDNKGEIVGLDSLQPYSGFHAMTVVGYDRVETADSGPAQVFKLINSWGPGWGDRGYLWLTEEAFRRLVKEVYFVSSVPAGDRRPIETGQRIGATRFKLNYQLSDETDLCLDANTYVDERPEEGFRDAIVYRCHNGENQIWDVILIEKPNTYLIRAYNGKFLSIVDRRLSLDDDDRTPNSRWMLSKSADGKRYIFTTSEAVGNFALGVDPVAIDAYSDTNPTPVELYRPNNSVFQEWVGQFVRDKQILKSIDLKRRNQ
ncbi:MAG: C1 family peptidase [Acidobacteria bacterium]|nr:C1 family peptidase [Acidobacteriota bacterium]